MTAARTSVRSPRFTRRTGQKLWSNNPIERLNKETKRRADGVEIFLNPASFLRLASTVAIEFHNECQVRPLLPYPMSPWTSYVP